MSSIRAALTARLKEALKARDALTTGTIRLILAALKDRDIAARERGIVEGVEEGEILALLQSLVKQRRESAAAYRAGAREDLAAREDAEIGVIETFLPHQLSEEEMATALDAVIAAVGATSVRDMGRVLAALRERYPGQVDPRAAGRIAKEKLGG
ncbi:MAG TPA: glutamyl-tRNA amidotransferase [Rhodospirillaceae bacterium]|jgi:uncharacterized protein YqeY|nr:GatB/YqeY domain-containing protein [Alphaproteobacteria bacterium]HBH25791.1 glutamyl-tRNA amidotransferase [Rhodospirillaceae bacterium]